MYYLNFDNISNIYNRKFMSVW